MLGQRKRKRRMSRWARKHQILHVLYYWDMANGLSMRQVAFWLQVSPSTHLMGLLRELQAEGKLKALEVPHRANINKYLWRLSTAGEESAAFHENVNWWAK